MKISKHTFRKLLNLKVFVLILLFASIVVEAPCFGCEFDPIDPQQVKHIRQVLEEKQDILNHASRKDIVVLMGSTGVGKSTLVNLLSKIPLAVDDEGNLIAEQNEGRLAIGSGFHSITKYPECCEIPDVGTVYDLPGFEDTEGTTNDVLNAALIGRILMEARSVKVLFMTSKADMDAGRGILFKRLLQAMNMFRNDEFQNTSCLLVVNKVDREVIEKNRTSQIFKGITSTSGSTEHSFLDALIEKNKVIFVPKTRVGDVPTILENTREELVRKIQDVKGGFVSNLHIALTFNVDTTQALVMYFHTLMQEQLKEMQKNVYPADKSSSSVLKTKKEHFWDLLQSLVSGTQEFQLLKSLGEKQYYIALKNFKLTFEGAHDLCVQELHINEMKELVKEAEFKNIQAEHRQHEALKRAAKAQEKVKALEEEKQAADNTAQRFAQEAEEARENSASNEEERNKALQRAKEAEEERKKLEYEIYQQKVAVERLFESQKQAEVYATTLRQAQAYAEQNKIRAENQLDQLRNSLGLRERELFSLRQDLDTIQRERVNVTELQRQIAYLQEQLRQKDFEIAQLRYQHQPQTTYRSPSAKESVGNGGSSYNLKAIAAMYHKGKMTQEEVAAHFGCSKSTVSRAHSEYYG